MLCIIIFTRESVKDGKVVIRLELCKFISLKKQPSVGKRLTAVFQYGFG